MTFVARGPGGDFSYGVGWTEAECQGGFFRLRFNSNPAQPTLVTDNSGSYGYVKVFDADTATLNDRSVKEHDEKVCTALVRRLGGKNASRHAGFLAIALRILSYAWKT
jgi:hypothetical protein